MRAPTSNPSSWGQRFLICFIALIGSSIALYLGLYQWGFTETVWDPVFGNGTINVLTSDVSHDLTRYIRIPDAILGIFAYLSDAVFALAGSKNRWRDRPWLTILFGINVIPIGIVSMILVLLQGLVVKHWCFLCLTSASISFILILLSYNEVFWTCRYLADTYRTTGFKRTWHIFWGN